MEKGTPETTFSTQNIIEENKLNSPYFYYEKYQTTQAATRIITYPWNAIPSSANTKASSSPIISRERIVSHV